jgi:hypothetical protein
VNLLFHFRLRTKTFSSSAWIFSSLFWSVSENSWINYRNTLVNKDPKQGRKDPCIRRKSFCSELKLLKNEDTSPMRGTSSISLMSEEEISPRE